MVERHVPVRGRSTLRGIPLLVLVTACSGLIGAPAASPALSVNDNFASAQDISLTPTTTGSNAEATAEVGEPDHGDPNSIAPVGSCAVGVSADGVVNPAFWAATFENPALHSMWFKWTAPAAGGCLTIDTFGSSFDTVMSVYTGTGYGSLTLVAGNDDYQPMCTLGARGVPTNSQQSCVKFNSTPGATYYIAVDSPATQFGGGGSGPFALNWSLPPPPMADLAVSKSTTATTVNAGEPIPYIIQVSNQGTAPASGSTLADTIMGATITSMTTNQGGCTAPTCSLGTIAAGQTVTVMLIATASAAGTVNTSTTVSTTALEPNLANNVSASTPVTINPAKPDLAVSASTSATLVYTGERISYRFSVTNQGSASAPNVTLTDTPTGATISSMSPSQGSCTPPTCSFGAIAAGSSATVTVVVTASAPGTVTNSATSNTTVVESNADNNTDRASDVAVTAMPTGCNLAGHVRAIQNFTGVGPDGGKVSVHIEVDAECGLDKKSNTAFVYTGRVVVQLNSGAALIDASLGDIRSVVLTGTSATIMGLYRGSVFTVTLVDGKIADTLAVVYPGFPTATSLTSPRNGVRIDLS